MGGLRIASKVSCWYIVLTWNLLQLTRSNLPCANDVTSLNVDLPRCYILHLLGAPDYEPLTRGMQVALPNIDHFLPVQNLARAPLAKTGCVKNHWR